MYDGPDDDPIPVGSDPLRTVIESVARVAHLLPSGQQVLTAVYDRQALASDVVLSDAGGGTQTVLGLARPEHDRLGALLTALRTDAVGPAPELRDLGPRVIVQGSPVPLIVLSAEAIVQFASPATAGVLALVDATETHGRFLSEFVHADDRDRVGRVFARALTTAQRLTVTARLGRAGAATLRAQLSFGPLGADPPSVILAVHPLEGDRADLETVRAGERRQRTLAGAADTGVGLIDVGSDTAGTVLDLNPAFARLLDAGPGELLGAALWDLVESDHVTRVRQAVRQVSAGHGPRRLEVTLAGAAARRVSLVIRADPGSGDPPSLATVGLADVSEHRGTVAELNATVERLLRENRQLAEFAQVTAHDLMAPLRALSELVGILELDAPDAPEEALGALRGAVSRMLAMVDSAVAYAGAQVSEIAQDSVDLNEILGYALDTLRPELDLAQAEVQAGDLPFVTGDAAQLERVLVSLLANAINYAGDRPPRVEIHAVPEGAMWRLSVADEGIGVPEGARESIFGLFERRAQGPVRSGAGRGIGLATCRQIIEGHGGRIWVEPGLPNGSIFSFTLPGN